VPTERNSPQPHANRAPLIEGEAHGSTRRAILALLVLAALVPLLATLRAGFVYDDTTIIRDNAVLRGWSALVRVWGAPYWPTSGVDVSGLYRPVHVAMLAAVWNAGQGSPLLFHLYALVLYAVVVALVWTLLRRGVGTTPAAVATLWFATHPLHVEAVASVANSSELLVVLFTLLLANVIGADRPAVESTSRVWGRALLVAALTCGAVLSKESGLLALPLAALTVWGWRRSSDGREARRLLRGGSRDWLAGAAAIVVALLARAAVLGAPVTRVSIAAPGLDVLSPVARIEAMMSLWPRIARMLLWPTALSPYYGPTILPTQRAGLAMIGALVVVTLMVYALVRARRGEPRPLVALGWAVLTYLPASNLLTATGQLIADRTLFGATVGIALAIGIVLERAPSVARRAALALCALAIVRGAIGTARYAEAWSSHRTLWTRLMETSPGE
jgi:protein O-mannosyl-transferase